MITGLVSAIQSPPAYQPQSSTAGSQDSQDASAEGQTSTSSVASSSDSRSGGVSGPSSSPTPSSRGVGSGAAASAASLNDRGEPEALGRDPRAAALAAWQAMQMERLIEQMGSAPAAPAFEPIASTDTEQTGPATPAVAKQFEEF